MSPLFVYIVQCFLLALAVVLPKKCGRKIEIIAKTLERDTRTVVAAVCISIKAYYYKYHNSTAVTEFEKVVIRHPDKNCILFEDDAWSFSQVDVYSNRVANVFRNAGFKKGDVVAIMMTNRPEYVCIWLGLGKIGVISSLINTNLRSKSLVHCLTTAGSKAVIFSNDVAEAVFEVRSSLESTVRYYQLGSNPKEGVASLDNALKVALPTIQKLPSIKFSDHLMYVYTSGTTGLPKAAIMPHSRFLLISVFARYLLGVTDSDVVYDPLPLYHTAGGLLGISSALTIGATVVLRSKFSASAYISDCAKYRCTISQYIGEICRYVLAVPPKPSDKEHCLRMIMGNGLRPVIWKQFSDRFNIRNVMEIYGSTEGNLQFVNSDNKIGAVGSIPMFLPSCLSRYIGAIIKVDTETMTPLRDTKGFCILCDIDEPGMFVGIIPPFKNALKEVYGYLDKKESNKKFIYDVFKKGDKAFVSGDLLVIDSLGYLYFKDRTGDTFRWKGENVATSEVEAVISSVIGLRDCVVYGVQVGDFEGRAGMAAIVDPVNQLDLDQLAVSLDSVLPKYAQPLFIRLLPEVELTGTFKLKKIKLQNEGFDPETLKDPIYFRSKNSYVRLTEELHRQILNGSIPI